MANPGTLICWNCSARTPPGTCVNCEALVSDPSEAFIEEENEAEPLILEIRRKGEENIKINFDDIAAIVQENFSVRRTKYSPLPQFVVEHPGTDLDTQFDQLLNQSEGLSQGFKPKIERYKNSDSLVISYTYDEPPAPTEYRTVFLLAMFSLLSVFMAAMFNYTKIQQALTITQPGLVVLGVVINLPSLLNSLLFTLTLAVLIIIKDIDQIRSLIRSDRNNVTPFYIPAPPIFELGTLGSVHKQSHTHKTKRQMFNSTFYGPVLSWFASLVVIALTLPMAVLNPDAAQSYADHSIVANGVFEPAIFFLLGNLTNAVGITTLDLSQPLTQQYILHPVTLAAMAGFYLTSFSLLPAAHFNGGYIIRSTLGKRAHGLLTYGSIFLLLTIHWLLASLVFFIHEILKSPDLLNEESQSPRNKDLVLIFYFLLLLVSFPMGFDLFSLYG